MKNNTSSFSGLTPALEDYIEAIYFLKKEHGVARNKDIAERLNVKRASVTGALKTLAEKGLINHKPHGEITLTEIGEEIAIELLKRHTLFKEFFNTILGMDLETSEQIACEIEHYFTKEAVMRLEIFMQLIKSCEEADAHCSIKNIERLLSEIKETLPEVK